MFRLITRRMSSIAFQYASDIHLEKRNFIPAIKAVAPNIILAGDIGNPTEDSYKEFLNNVSGDFDNVFLTTGNHEYYQDVYNKHEVDFIINDITIPLPNVHFLNNGHYVFNDQLNILGTTLWSQVNNKSTRLSGDDLKIKQEGEPIGTDGINDLHGVCKKWLEMNIWAQNKDLLIITHYLPSFQLILDRFKNGYWGDKQDRFASDLEYLMDDKVKAWVCGHSHVCHETEINDVPVFINSCPRNKTIRAKVFYI